MNLGDLGINGERFAQRLAGLGNGCTFIDVGVREGVSSEIMLIDAIKRGNDVIGIDASECPPTLRKRDCYGFLQGDSVSELVDLATWLEGADVSAAMVDTLHIAEQVMCETYYLWPMLKHGGFIAYHDTSWPVWKKDHYLGRDWDTPDVGVMKMFAEAWEAGSVEIEQFHESWGMMFVWKRTDFDLHAALDWKPVFAARNELLKILPEGVRKREIVV